jgi:hypothetical protein
MQINWDALRLGLGALGGSLGSSLWAGIVDFSQVEPFQLIIVTAHDTHANHILRRVS